MCGLCAVLKPSLLVDAIWHQFLAKPMLFEPVSDNIQNRAPLAWRITTIGSGHYFHRAFHVLFQLTSVLLWGETPPICDLLSKRSHLRYILTMFCGSFRNHVLQGQIVNLCLSWFACKTNRGSKPKIGSTFRLILMPQI